MTDSAQSKKRKRQTDGDDQLRIALSLSEAGSGAAGPVLVTFPSLHPSQSTAFKYYVKHSKKSNDETLGEFASQGGIVAGETDTVEFHSGDIDQSDQSCQYLLGVYDKSSKRVTLRKAPLHILEREVKALKSLDPLAVSQVDERTRARNALGEAFGSKKAKKAIRTAERNRVDVSTMGDAVDHIHQSVGAGTASLPSQEAAKAATDEHRPIPPFNLHAKTPEEVYILDDMIAEAEMNSISVSKVSHASDYGTFLPYQRSSWVNQHLAAERDCPKPNKNNLKILFYIASMFLFRNISRGSVERAELQKRMPYVPGEVIDGLTGRYTERSRNSTTPQVTKYTETLLLTYMFALCLRLDHYATDPTLLAGDLKMSVPAVVGYFKQLGCKYETLTVAERTQLGLGPTDVKRCILKVPFDFPEQKMKRYKK